MSRVKHMLLVGVAFILGACLGAWLAKLVIYEQIMRKPVGRAVWSLPEGFDLVENAAQEAGGAEVESHTLVPVADVAPEATQEPVSAPEAEVVETEVEEVEPAPEPPKRRTSTAVELTP